MKRRLADWATKVSAVIREGSWGGKVGLLAALFWCRGVVGVGLCLLGSGISVQAAGLGEVVARGKGFEIRQGEVDDLVVEQKLLLRGAGQAVGAEEEALLEERTLDRLVVREILLGMATAEERETARKLVEANTAEQVARLGSEDAYRRQIFKLGTTPEVFSDRMLAQAVADQVIFREVRSKIEVTDEQVRRFYDEGEDVNVREVRKVAERLGREGPDTAFYAEATNRLATLRQKNLERLVRPDQARAQMLVLFTRDPLTRRPLSDEIQRIKLERMERLRQRVMDGEDFAVLASEFSEEPDAARNRAEYMATKPQVTFPELRQALFTVPIGELSEVIRTELGYYLVRVLERQAGGKVPFDEAKDDIRALLLNQETEQRLPAWFEQLKRDHEVEVTRR